MKTFGIIMPQFSAEVFCTLVFKNQKDEYYIQKNGSFIEYEINDKGRIIKISNPKDYSGEQLLAYLGNEGELLIGTLNELSPMLNYHLYDKNLNPLSRLNIAKKLKLAAQRIDILVDNAKRHFKKNNSNETIDYSIFYSE